MKELIIDFHRKRTHFQALGMQNTAGLTHEESEAQSIEYELARESMYQAEKALRKAQRECTTPRPNKTP